MNRIELANPLTSWDFHVTLPLRALKLPHCFTNANLSQARFR
jgi:hypothetical protein